jgi:hypothetical protein
VDNTPPVIEVRQTARGSARPGVTFAVQDDQSAVLRVEYSRDGARWRVAYPLDGIADSRHEDFDVTLDTGDTAKSIIIRATDAMNNVSTAVADVRR